MTVKIHYFNYEFKFNMYHLRLKACEQRRSELFAKQGRVQQFSSKEKRDRWIEKELQSLQQSAQQKEQQVQQPMGSNYPFIFSLFITSV